MKIDPAQLVAALRSRGVVVHGYDDGPAALAALAGVESDFDDSIIGDLTRGRSYGLWQMNAPSWPMYSYPPPPFPAQVDWMLNGPIVAKWNQAAGESLPYWWRTGATRGMPTPLDAAREFSFRRLYRQLRAGAYDDAAPPPPPGGGGGGAIFSAAPTPDGGPTMSSTIIPPAPSATSSTGSTLKEKLHAIRLAADKVRATVDQVATVVTSIPFVGAMLGAYVRGIVAVVDGLDTTIDALDGAL